MFPERRRAARKRTKIPLYFRVKGSQNFSMSVSEDISLGGIYFFALHPLGIGQKIYLKLNRPGRKSCLCVEARIVRCALVTGAIVPTYGIAAEFLPLSSHERQIIGALM